MNKYIVNHDADEAHEIVLRLIRSLAKGAMKDDDEYREALVHISQIASEALVSEY